MQFASFRHHFRQSSADNAQVVHSYRYLIAILDASGMLGSRVFKGNMMLQLAFSKELTLQTLFSNRF